MRLIHSLNTRPLFINCYGVDSLQRLAGNIWYYSLSVAYARSIGVPIELHTDSLGAALLGHLPYDRIHLTLDGMPDTLHPRFWAAGKMWALESAGPGAVHIDGDVFIKRREIADGIDAADWDFIAQHYEHDTWNDREYELFRAAPRICADNRLDAFTVGAYNTGVIGFRDPELMREYVDTYRRLAFGLSDACGHILDQGTHLTPDVIIEQRLALQLCRRRGARVRLVLPAGADPREYATRIGYQHVITACKFSHLDRCRTVLERLSPDIHHKTSLLCRNILK